MSNRFANTSDILESAVYSNTSLFAIRIFLKLVLVLNLIHSPQPLYNSTSESSARRFIKQFCIIELTWITQVTNAYTCSTIAVGYTYYMFRWKVSILYVLEATMNTTVRLNYNIYCYYSISISGSKLFGKHKILASQHNQIAITHIPIQPWISRQLDTSLFRNSE